MTSALTLNSTQNATFAGDIALSQMKKVSFRDSGTQKAYIEIDSNNDVVHYAVAGTDLKLYANANLSCSINHEGLLLNGSRGIQFGSNDVDHTLDDYEEGTWTAACDNSVTLHSTNDRCSYTKIGRQVTVTGSIRVNSDNSDAEFIINNLPFTSNSEAGAAEGTGISTGDCRLYAHAVPSTTMGVHCLTSAGANTLTFQCDLTTGAASTILPAAADGYVVFSCTYFTAE
jgi:hypothetical protein